MARKAAQGKGNKLPLYATAYEKLVERVQSGRWAPGQRIPNEFEVADELGVSQGTARKAVNRLATENLLVRVQGRGTFVVEPTPEHFHYRFFNVFDANGVRIIPDNRVTRIAIGKPNPFEQHALGLRKNARLIRFHRMRMHGQRPLVTEVISLPARTYPGLESREERPQTLYDVFQRDYGVVVQRTDERITAVAADAKAASELEIAPETPLLRIERIAIALDGRPVEYRVSLCHLSHAHYRTVTE